MLKYLVLALNFLFFSDTCFSATEAGLPGEIVMGQDHAPIVIYGYSSLTCGHCAVFHETVLPHLQPYIERGEVKYIFRHFPTDRQAVLATAFATSLPIMRRWEVIGKLFKTQSKWMKEKDPAGTFAQLAGMDVKKCKEIIKNKNFLDQALRARILAEKKLNIDGTPFFVINGRIVNYALSWDELKKYLQPSKG